MTSSGPGQVLFRFVRHWARRAVTADVEGDQGRLDQGRLVLTCEAVHSLSERGVPATVNAVAHEIGIDQSGASRLIARAAAAGCLLMAVSPADGRRREASLTPAARSLLDEAHRWQDEVFAQLTADWSEQRRQDFHRAMTDLIERSSAVDALTRTERPT